MQTFGVKTDVYRTKTGLQSIGTAKHNSLTLEVLMLLKRLHILFSPINQIIVPVNLILLHVQRQKTPLDYINDSKQAG